MSQFRVIDLQPDVIDPEVNMVEARSPEHAAELVLGVQLVRSGAKRDLRARVYYKNSETVLNMVRLYSRVADRVPL